MVHRLSRGLELGERPLFGAAVSGYSVDGHVLDYSALGPTIITGGDVGPEGSVFAYGAMLLALLLLLASTRRRTETDAVSVV